MEKIGRERVYVLIFYQTPKSRFDIKRWTAHVIDGGLTATRLRNLKRRFSQTNQYRENKRRKRIHHHVCRELRRRTGFSIHPYEIHPYMYDESSIDCLLQTSLDVSPPTFWCGEDKQTTTRRRTFLTTSMMM